MAPIGLPYRGWYNGNIELMKANGTYADFRHMLVKKVADHKMSENDLAMHDAEWEAIPLEEKMSRRELVVFNTIPKLVVVQTHEGPLSVLKSVPDENDNIYKQRQKEKVAKVRKLPAGSLTAENNPLLASSAK